MDNVERQQPADPRALYETALAYLGRHLVCLNGTYVELDAQGKAKSKEKLFSFSGFIMSFRGRWCLVTAGHVLDEELDENIRNKRIQLRCCGIADYFGLDAKVPLPTIIDYENTPKLYIDDQELGLDFGVMPLRDLYQANLAANGILPIAEENWVRQEDVEFEAFGILGFPDELKPEPGTRMGDHGQEIVGHVHAILIPIQRLPDETMEAEGRQFPWFVGKVLLPPDRLQSVVGMSGGPIFGFRRVPGEGLSYWVVAMQSWWNKETRVIYGCPVPIFARLVEEVLDSGTGHESSS